MNEGLSGSRFQYGGTSRRVSLRGFGSMDRLHTVWSGRLRRSTVGPTTSYRTKEISFRNVHVFPCHSSFHSLTVSVSLFISHLVALRIPGRNTSFVRPIPMLWNISTLSVPGEETCLGEDRELNQFSHSNLATSRKVMHLYHGHHNRPCTDQCKACISRSGVGTGMQLPIPGV